MRSDDRAFEDARASGADPASHVLQELEPPVCTPEPRDGRADQQAAAGWAPRASVHTGPSGARIVLEIPGVLRDDVSLTVVGSELIVRGERRPTVGGDVMKALVVEYACGPFERRFPLPDWCSPAALSARCAHGMLEVDLCRASRGDAVEFEIEIG